MKIDKKSIIKIDKTEYNLDSVKKLSKTEFLRKHKNNPKAESHYEDLQSVIKAAKKTAKED